ncbi:uncharacterized protein [Fopius arisanus]|uniref:Uncharacterized protein isoform X2 n=1 Tax=Fopius arisanus TaxID=64838 RepID=A0A9R1UA75_9HYME|nr:PREDICTED: uncharacterized protein LOC105273335 isoform X2 [Fopius arisanus]
MSEIVELAHSVENSTASKGMEGRQWMEKFKAMLLLNRFTPGSLISLMTYYARNVQPSVSECQPKPLKVEKLRESISETLRFFLYCYRAQREETERTDYMDTMSDLLAMYIDIELKASKRSDEAQSNISARLTSYLYICLDNSHQHLMDTLLKVQFLSSTYHQILDPLIEKILQMVPEHPINGVMYVRYFLVYRIWKRINKGSPMKDDIAVKAKTSLRSSPPALPEYLVDSVLPKVPNDEKITTEVLLIQKFDLEKSAENFLKFVKDSRELPPVQSPQSTQNEKQPEDKSAINSKKKLCLSRRLPGKLSEVVLIDLTNDETSGRVLKQKKKSGRRLSWLQEVAKRKMTSSSAKEDSTTEDSQKLDLSLFLTTDGDQSIIIEDQRERESSGTDIGSQSLTERTQTVEIDSCDPTRVPQIDDIVIPSLQDSPAAANEVERVTMESETIESGIKVQIEVQSELEETTEINELKCEDNITEILKSEIIDDANSTSTNLVTEYQRDTVLHINQRLDESRKNVLERLPEKMIDTEYQEQHIDGLSLLASVSQRISHLSTATTSHPINPNREIIKVKDYKSLTDFGSTNDILESNNIDEVAFQVEVSSSEDISDNCTSVVYPTQRLDKLPTDEDNGCPSTSVDSSIQSEREETNVILNGETVFLYQKSPNSNLYIINKAIENHEDEETTNLSEKMSPIEGIDEVNYPYEIYDKMYRISQPPVPQIFDDPRRAQKVKVTASNDSNRAVDLQKSGKKASIEAKSPRRHRMRQEFNGCPSDLVDPHSIRIPTAPLYHANYPTPELFISCPQNCSSVTCAIPVNHSASPIHSHPNSSRCTCLNCRYDIVTHCTQCIIPPGDAQTTSGIDGGYYIGIQPTSVLKDCSLEANTQNDVKPFDDKPLYSIELGNGIDNNHGILKNVNSKLPLKKRFSMMSASFVETLQTDKSIGNYSNLSIKSIATRDNSRDGKLSPRLQKEEENVINGYHFDDLELKQSEIGSGVPIKSRKSPESGISRPSKNVMEPKTPTKNSKRQTRLSKRKVPRVNYNYPDDEIDRNPSGVSRRKRKRTR